MILTIIANLILLVAVTILVIKYKKLKSRIIEIYDYIGSTTPKNPILKLQNELKEYYKIEDGLIKLKVIKYEDCD